MSEKLDRAVDREEKALEDSLSNGEISMQEYNQSLREVYQMGREEERRERCGEDPYDPRYR